jgi:tRNA(fMet)-specific endonuclease VapC
VTWLLDTCALSDFAKGEHGTISRLKSVPPSQVAITSVSVMEVEYGLERLSAKARAVAPLMRSLMGAV